jgi:hypothetical protein
MEAAEGALDPFEQDRGGRNSNCGNKLAKSMDTRHSILCLSAANQPRHLHDQRHRERTCQTAQNHQDAQHFPSDEAATKLIFLALRNITADWERAAPTGNRP